MQTYKIASIRYIDAESIDEALKLFREQPLARSLEVQTVTLVKSAAPASKSPVNGVLAQAGELAAVAASQLGVAQRAPICPLHSVQMTKRSGSRGEFWSCGRKNEDGSWCRYRPPRG